jgi:hypothetical protein
MGREARVREADGSKVSAARPEDRPPGVAVGDERPSINRGRLPLLIVFVALALATVWFVALPALDKPPPTKGSCGMIVVSRSGSARCVEEATLGARATSGRHAVVDA